jgi:hypothetical protein
MAVGYASLRCFGGKCCAHACNGCSYLKFVCQTSLPMAKDRPMVETERAGRANSFRGSTISVGASPQRTATGGKKRIHTVL